MTKGIDVIFTYDQFEQHIENLIKLARKEALLEEAFDVNIENTILDKYITFLAELFPLNSENYFVDLCLFWKDWQFLVEYAIISFVYGVVDYRGEGDIVAPRNHELLHLKSINDEVNINSEDYIVSIDSVQKLWMICTGEIPVRERFS